MEVNGQPEIFFKVDVDEIPPGKQICYDYSDNRRFDSSADLNWLKNKNDSSDDEGKAFAFQHQCGFQLWLAPNVNKYFLLYTTLSKKCLHLL
jgi:hypothetical protein